MARALAIGLFVAGGCSWFFPGFNGTFFAPSNIDLGTGRIVGAICIVGAAILWMVPSRTD